VASPSASMPSMPCIHMAGIVHLYRRRRYHKRVHAEHAKPLEQYTSEELYARFRFGRDDIKYIADLVRPTLQHQTQRSHALSVEEQCLIALRFYACGTFYQVIGDNMGVRKATVSNVVKAIQLRLSTSFFQMGNMPSTIGAIDCTHVHIQAPREREWEYVNRKGRHSINIQLVGNADLIITNSGTLQLLTCKTRCAIECLNGVLKRRFACLNYLREQPKVACNIILACIVLHNIATRRHVPLDDNFDGPAPDVEPEQPPMFLPNEGHTGHSIIDAIVRNYF
uniref:Putative nuclease HARBI1 n=1 Tax=Sinocyclocheilus grahami TaxID=75366 RepID=A0A672LWG1_SINGR